MEGHKHKGQCPYQIHRQSIGSDTKLKTKGKSSLLKSQKKGLNTTNLLIIVEVILALTQIIQNLS